MTREHPQLPLDFRVARVPTQSQTKGMLMRRPNNTADRGSTWLLLQTHKASLLFDICFQ